MFKLAAIENIFFLVLVAIVGLVRWIAAAAENKRNKDAAKRAQAAPNAPPPRAPAMSEEERVRRFMEALGVPTSSAPASPTQPRRQVTPQKTRELPRKVRPIDPFPRPRIGEWTPAPLVVVPEPVVVPTPSSTVKVLAPAPEKVFSPAPALLPSAEYDIDVRTTAKKWARQLATTEGLREAIILREIFGPRAAWSHCRHGRRCKPCRPRPVHCSRGR